MAAPRKYPEELRERAIRMAVDLRRDPDTKAGAVKRVGDQLGINPETLRKAATLLAAFEQLWIQRATKIAEILAEEGTGT